MKRLTLFLLICIVLSSCKDSVQKTIKEPIKNTKDTVITQELLESPKLNIYSNQIIYTQDSAISFSKNNQVYLKEKLSIYGVDFLTKDLNQDGKTDLICSGWDNAYRFEFWYVFDSKDSIYKKLGQFHDVKELDSTKSIFIDDALINMDGNWSTTLFQIVQDSISEIESIQCEWDDSNEFSRLIVQNDKVFEKELNHLSVDSIKENLEGIWLEWVSSKLD